MPAVSSPAGAKVSSPNNSLNASTCSRSCSSSARLPIDAKAMVPTPVKEGGDGHADDGDGEASPHQSVEAIADAPHRFEVECGAEFLRS